MAIFKIEKCRACGYKHNEPKPQKQNKPCPKCGTGMYYIENWYISFQVDGVKYPMAVAPQRREAEAALAKKKALIRENKFFEMKNRAITFREAAEKLKKTYHRLLDDTIRMYENSLKILQRHGFDRLRLDQIDIDRINDYIADRQDEGVTNSTINRELASIKRMTKICKIYDLYNEIELLKENDARTRFLTEAEQDALIKECTSPQLRLAVLIALNTGLRKEGVYHLRWTEIDFQGKTISRVVKGGKTVHIPLTERLERELKAYRQTAILSTWVFPSPSKIGEPVRKDNNRPFGNACKRAGITGFRFHDLRHTFASHFLMSTGDLKSLQELLGHHDIKMTMRYAHLLDRHKREAMKKFEENRG